MTNEIKGDDADDDKTTTTTTTTTVCFLGVTSLPVAALSLVFEVSRSHTTTPLDE